MNRQEIEKILPHRDNMLLLDDAELVDGVAVGHYHVRGDEFFLRGHFPGNPIVPDVILCSKAIGGTQPMSVVIYNKELDKWTPGAHAGTFRGNQLAMRAGTVVMNRVAKEEFLAEVREKGDYLREKMMELKNKVSIIGDIRGKGLMSGCEFVDPKGTPDMLGSLPASGEIAALVQKKCFENKLVMEKGGRHGSVMRCLCALNVSKEELDTMIAIFEKVVIEVDNEFKK